MRPVFEAQRKLGRSARRACDRHERRAGQNNKPSRSPCTQDGRPHLEPDLYLVSVDAGQFVKGVSW